MKGEYTGSMYCYQINGKHQDDAQTSLGQHVWRVSSSVRGTWACLVKRPTRDITSKMSDLRNKNQKQRATYFNKK